MRLVKKKLAYATDFATVIPRRVYLHIRTHAHMHTLHNLITVKQTFVN